MANTFDFKLRGDADVSRIEAAINTIKKSMEGADLSASFSKQFATIFKNLTESQIKLSQNLSPINKDQFQEMLKFGKQVGTQYTNLVARIASVSQKSSDQLKEFLPQDTVNKIKKANSALDAYTKSTTEIGNKIKANNAKIKDWNKSLDETQQKLKEAKNSPSILSTDEIAKVQTDLATVNSEIEKINRALNKTGKDAPGAEEVKKLTAQLEEAYQKQNKFNTALDANKQARNVITDLTKEQDKLTESIKEATTANNQLSGQRLSGFTALKKTLSDLGFDVSQAGLKFEDFETLVKDFEQAGIQGVVDTLEAMARAAKDGEGAFNGLSSSLDETKTEYEEFEKALKGSEELKNKVKQFFTAANAVQLFRRAITNAFNTIKELDAIMTETAVVTDFDVGDMWSQLPEYTERANKLGVAISDTYKAATLYYQQGLKTNEVVGVSNQTLKMARIAGLDAAEATNKMTAALRGFNMEVTEANATRVSDVYSKLAAITASDVEEISSAMTKTASLASNAGMQFETTAAFLSQIIETTRESAETAGTALKTVIARFQELKKSPDEIGEVDGEVVDANKIESALKTVGVSLRDASGQFRELDEVFLELASKWDTLDKNTQRYIATIAAGSRQQSRFIAMMSDYKRTQELVAAANNSAGAANQQYEKTLDSLDAKLKQLKNAYDEFTLSIANSDFIKGAIDLVTGLITALNKLTSVLPKPLNGFAKLGIALGTFKTAGKWFNSFSIEVQKKGVGAIDALRTSSKQTFGEMLDNIKKAFNKKTWNYEPIKQGAAALEQLKEVAGTADDRLNVVAAATQGLGQQAKIYDMALREGLPVQEASVALLLTDAEATELQTKLKQDGIKEEKKAIIAEALHNKETEAGLLTKTKWVIQMLFGNKALRKEARDNLIAAGATWLKAGADEGATASQWSLNAAIYACPLGWFALAIAAVIASLAALAIALYQVSDAAEMKRLTESAEKFEEQLNSINENINNINEERSSLEELNDTFNNLTKGTSEWRKSLVEVNNKVMELTDKYPELQNWVKIGENGQLTIDEQGWDAVLETLNQQYVATSNALTAVKMLQNDISNKQQLRHGLNEAEFGLSNISTRDNERNRMIQERMGLWGTIGQMALPAFGGTPGAGAGIGGGIAALTASGGDIGVAFEAAVREPVARALAFMNESQQKINNLQEKFFTNKTVATIGDILTLGGGTAMKSIYEGLSYQQELSEHGGLTRNDFIKFMSAISQAGLGGNASESELKAVFDSMGLSASWDKVYARLQEFGDGLDKVITSSNAMYEAQKQQVSTMVSNTMGLHGDILESEFADAVSSIITDSNMDISEEIQNEVDDMGSEAMDKEYAEIMGITEAEVKLMRKRKEVSGDTIRQAVAANRVQQRMSDEMEETYKTLSKVGDLGDTLKRFGREGSKLNQSDIKTLLGEDWQQLSKASRLKKITDTLVSAGMSLEEAAKQAQTYNEQITMAEERYEKAQTRLRGVSRVDANYAFSDQLSSSAISGLSDQFVNIATSSGSLVAANVSQSLASLMEGLDRDQVDQFASILNSLDWKDLNDWATLAEKLAKEDIPVVNSALTKFIKEASEAAKATDKVDPKKLYESTTNTALLRKQLSTGEQGRTFDESAYNALIEAIPSLAKDFGKTLNGEYIYLGTNMASLYGEIKNLTVDKLEMTTNRLEAEIGLGEAFKNVTDKNVTNRVHKRFDIAKESGYNLDSLGINGLSNTTSWDQIKGDKEIILALDKAFDEYIAKLSENKDTLSTYQKELKTTLMLEQRITQNATKLQEEDVQKVILMQAQEAGVASILIDAWRAATEGVDKYLTTVANTTALKKSMTAVSDSIDVIKDAIESYGEATDGYVRFVQAQSIGAQFGIDITKISEADSGNFMDSVGAFLQGDEQAYLTILKTAIAQGGLRTSAQSIDELNQELLESPRLAKFVQDQIINKGLGWATNERRGDKEVVQMRSYSGILDELNKKGLGREKDWENPYTWLYNMNERINGQIRERDKLERQYTRTLENRKGHAMELVELSKKELDNLRQQQHDERQRQSYAAEEIRELQKKYSEFQGLYEYSDEKGIIRVDQEKADSLSAYQGEAFEKFISRIEELRNVMDESEENLDEISKQVKEIRFRGRDQYVEIENKIRDALIWYYTEQIDELEKIGETIEDTNSKLISSIQDTVAKQRQERQNQETEQNLSDKQRRLAYLQMDTSGANATEILKLQDELAKDQQSYTDTLVDQAIDEMEKANQIAQEQREQQISIMRSQLDYARDAGLLWDKVHSLFDTDVRLNGEIKEGSWLGNLLRGADGWAAMSKDQKEIWNTDIQPTLKEAKIWAGQELYNYIAQHPLPTPETVIPQNFYEETNTYQKGVLNTIDSFYEDWKTWAGLAKPETKFTHVESDDQPTFLTTGSTSGVRPGTRLSGAVGYTDTGTGTPGKTTQTNTVTNAPDPVEIVQEVIDKYKLPSTTTEQAFYKIITTKDGGLPKADEIMDAWRQANRENLHWWRYDAVNGWKRYAAGGLANFTGPAWLDGTPSQPELVLNSKDTQNFIALRDILSNLANNGTSIGGDTYYDIDIDVDSLQSDYDVEQLADKIRSMIAADATYRNVNTLNRLR